MVQIDMEMPKCCADCPCGNAQDGWCYVHNEVLERMENGYPSTETRPKWCPMKEVKHGKWLPLFNGEYTGGAYWFECSECRTVVSGGLQSGNWFCKGCGARMEE